MSLFRREPKRVFTDYEIFMRAWFLQIYRDYQEENKELERSLAAARASGTHIMHWEDEYSITDILHIEREFTEKLKAAPSQKEMIELAAERLPGLLRMIASVKPTSKELKDPEILARFDAVSAKYSPSTLTGIVVDP